MSRMGPRDTNDVSLGNPATASSVLNHLLFNSDQDIYIQGPNKCFILRPVRGPLTRQRQKLGWQCQTRAGQTVERDSEDP